MQFPGSFERFHKLDRESYNQRIDSKEVVGFGHRDRGPAYNKGYREYIGNLYEKGWVVLYDVEADCGWLIDGPSALLHLVRASMALQNSGPAEIGQPKLSITNEAVDPLAACHALLILLDEANKRTLLRSNESFEERVLDILCLMKVIFAEQEKLGHRGNNTLTGFTFIDLVQRNGKVGRYQKGPDKGFNAWINLVKGIKAAVLFGRGFGDLFVSATPGKNCPWRVLHKDKQHLAVRVRDLRRIVRGNDGLTEKPWAITDKAYWLPPRDVFVHDSCSKSCMHNTYEPTQILLSDPKSHETVGTSYENFDDLPITGAVIFGYNSTNAEAADAATEISETSDSLSNITGFTETTRPTTPDIDSEYPGSLSVEDLSRPCCKSSSADAVTVTSFSGDEMDRSRVLRPPNVASEVTRPVNGTTRSQNGTGPSTPTIRPHVSGRTSPIVETTWTVLIYVLWTVSIYVLASWAIIDIVPQITLSFYWRTLYFSTFFTIMYCFAMNPIPPWELSLYRRNRMQEISKTIVLVVLMGWLLCLTHFHLLISPIDLWAEYRYRESVGSKVIYFPLRSSKPDIE